MKCLPKNLIDYFDPLFYALTFFVHNQSTLYLVIDGASLATENLWPNFCEHFAPPVLMAVFVALFLFDDETFLLHRVYVPARQRRMKGDYLEKR